MSHFPGKTIEEIAELTAEQVDRYTKLAMANAGIPIFIDTGDSPKLELKKDSAIYTIGGFAFAYKSDAEKVRDLVETLNRVKARYNRKTYSTEETFEEDDGTVDVTTVPMFSPEMFAEKATILEHHRILTEEREAALCKAAKFDRERDALRDAISTELQEARSYVRNRERVVNLYHQYLDLAEGDRQIAWNFLNKIERLSAEDIAEMKLAECLQLDGLELEWNDATVPELQAV